ncbi:biotin transport system substrate-specific component [Bryocella elongata]|uniref:Biotin transporter n=1 Tax=Bryocella elongata TaxID=863522 RepID=A0A1H5UJ46_9BACT|nr:biotin transporter BioY [Bryocella elongata]SEF75059.1 biotin transport system substrate-specific component [Bryocella elongata]
MSQTAVSPLSAPRPTLRSVTASLAGTVPGRIALGLAATLVVAAAAHVAFPLPFTPVPFILTPLAVLAVGLAFGPMGGFAVLAAYLLEGACGLPVFSPTGPGGVAQLVGPTGGYLMSYPLVAMVAGLATRMSPRMPRFLAATLSGVAAMTILFAFGAGWLAHWNEILAPGHVSLQLVAMSAIVPFLPGEIVKVLAAAGIYSTLRRSR